MHTHTHTYIPHQYKQTHHLYTHLSIRTLLYAHMCSGTYIIPSPNLSHRHMYMYPLAYTFIQRHIQIHFFNPYSYTHTDTHLIYIYIYHPNTHTCTYYPLIHILTQPHSKISSHPCVNSSTFIYNPLNHTLTPTCTYTPPRHIHTH